VSDTFGTPGRGNRRPPSRKRAPTPPAGIPGNGDPIPPRGTSEWRAWVDEHFPRPEPDLKPDFGTPAWHEWMDRHYSARPARWFRGMARRSQERGGRTAKQRDALLEWNRYRADGLVVETDEQRLARAGGRDFSSVQAGRISDEYEDLAA
jgi:hypothetical protein